MKTKFIFLIAMVFSCMTMVNAQSQKELFKKWGDTDLTCFGSNCNSDAKYKMSLHDWDKPYMWYVTLGNQFKYQKANYYSVPEQQAHPTFLTSGSSWGDDKMKYFMKFTSQGGNYYTTSVLIIGDLLYEIEELKDHTWKVNYIFTKGRYKALQIFKLEKKRKELAKIDHNKIVNDYLKKEKATLDAKTPAYKKANKAYFDRFSKEKGWANQDIKDSYKELYRQRVGEAVRIVNNRRNTVFIGFKGRGSIPNNELKPGAYTTIKCNLSDIYMFFSDDVNAKPIKRLFTPKDWCGKKYIIK